MQDFLAAGVVGGFILLVVLFRLYRKYYTRTGYRGRVYGSGRGIHREDDTDKVGAILDRPDDGAGSS
jgi:hypothetical protein